MCVYKFTVQRSVKQINKHKYRLNFVPRQNFRFSFFRKTFRICGLSYVSHETTIFLYVDFIYSFLFVFLIFSRFVHKCHTIILQHNKGKKHNLSNFSVHCNGLAIKSEWERKKDLETFLVFSCTNAIYRFSVKQFEFLQRKILSNECRNTYTFLRFFFLFRDITLKQFFFFFFPVRYVFIQQF